MLVLAMEFSRDGRAEVIDAERVVHETRTVAPSKRNRGPARPAPSPWQEAEACDHRGLADSRIASDQLRSSLS